MRPSVAGARRLMVRSSVDFPAPERPITPTKLPGATEKEALSTAALAPKRHVKPSTTNMRCSGLHPLRPPLALVSYSFVTGRIAARGRAGMLRKRVTELSKLSNMVDNFVSRRRNFADGRQDSLDRADDRSHCERAGHDIRQLLRGRRTHD